MKTHVSVFLVTLSLLFFIVPGEFLSVQADGLDTTYAPSSSSSETNTDRKKTPKPDADQSNKDEVQKEKQSHNKSSVSTDAFGSFKNQQLTQKDLATLNMYPGQMQYGSDAVGIAIGIVVVLLIVGIIIESGTMAELPEE